MTCLGKCCENNTSHREEIIHDLTVNVSGVHDLNESLAQEFVVEERFNGDNQVRCPGCDRKSDATRRTKLKRAPKVLTIALNRFTYDWERGRRQKLTTSFAFPTTLNVTPYCCDKTISTTSRKDREYVLYSVVVHGGGARSGHYTAFVRDFAGQGQWESPRRNQHTSSHCSSNHNSARVPPSTNGCSEGEWTTVSSGGPRRPPQAGTAVDDELGAVPSSDASGADAPRASAMATWFKCNDGSVTPADTADLATVYSGSQCAYMLFYVQQTHLDSTVPLPDTTGNADVDARPSTSLLGGWQYPLPAHLAQAVDAENTALQTQRQAYDAAVNAIDIAVWTPRDLHYDVDGNALVKTEHIPQSTPAESVVVTVDKRISLEELLGVICRETGITAATPSPAGDGGAEDPTAACGRAQGDAITCASAVALWNLEPLPTHTITAWRATHEVAREHLQSSVEAAGVRHGTVLFVCHGTDVNGVPVALGADSPMPSHLKAPDVPRPRLFSREHCPLVVHVAVVRPVPAPSHDVLAADAREPLPALREPLPALPVWCTREVLMARASATVGDVCKRAGGQGTTGTTTDDTDTPGPPAAWVVWRTDGDAATVLPETMLLRAAVAPTTLALSVVAFPDGASARHRAQALAMHRRAAAQLEVHVRVVHGDGTHPAVSATTTRLRVPLGTARTDAHQDEDNTPPAASTAAETGACEADAATGVTTVGQLKASLLMALGIAPHTPSLPVATVVAETTDATAPAARVDGDEEALPHVHASKSPSQDTPDSGADVDEAAIPTAAPASPRKRRRRKRAGAAAPQRIPTKAPAAHSTLSAAMEAHRLRLYPSAARALASSRLLHDTQTLCDAGVTPASESIHVALEQAAALSADVYPLKVQLGCKAAQHSGMRAQHQLWEFLAPNKATVRECTALAVAAVGVTADNATLASSAPDPTDARTAGAGDVTAWHLCTTGWNGDMGVVLDDLDRPLSAAKVKPNDVLLLEAGSILPRGSCDVQLSWFRPHLFGTVGTDCASVAGGVARALVRRYLAAAVQLVCMPDMLAAVRATGSTAEATTAHDDDGNGTVRTPPRKKRTTKRTRTPMGNGQQDVASKTHTEPLPSAQPNHTPSSVDSEAATGSAGLAAYIDNIDLAADDRIVPLGPLRCPNLLSPRELLTNYVAAMPRVQRLLRAHADALFPSLAHDGTSPPTPSVTDTAAATPPALEGWLQRVRIREVKEGHLARVLCDPAALAHTAATPKARLYTTQHLCLEFLDLQAPAPAAPARAADTASPADTGGTIVAPDGTVTAAPGKESTKLPAHISTFLPASAVRSAAKPKKHVVGGGKKTAAPKKKGPGKSTGKKTGKKTGKTNAQKGALLYVHAARRDRARRSYHRTVEVALPAPVVADTLRTHLADATGIAPSQLCAFKRNRKTHTWSPLLHATATAAEGTPPGPPAHSDHTPKSQKGLKLTLKSGDVIAVADAAEGDDDMTCGADRAHARRHAWLGRQRARAVVHADNARATHTAAATGDGPVLRINVPASFDSAA
eukprot:m.683287 g.683287  ORF g.683287 m.683287 type:complete len:1529 (-) comp22828_c1_seq5:341-4927(-)